MVSTNNFTAVYAEALLIGAPKECFSPPQPKPGRKIKPEVIVRREMEMDSLGREYKACEAVFFERMLQLTVFRRWVIPLTESDQVNRFIGTRHSGIHAELEAIVASETVC